jgi:hypothetical protein
MYDFYDFGNVQLYLWRSDIGDADANAPQATPARRPAKREPVPPAPALPQNRLATYRLLMKAFESQN